MRNQRTDEQAGRHAREAEEQRLQCDLVGGLERREPLVAGLSFGLEAALLHEVEHGGEQAEKERRVCGEDERDMEEDPDAAVDGEAGPLLAGVKRRNQAEDED